jgi:hypothetical protein
LVVINQHVFIDDSGDPGFKLNKGSSSHFVIACVIFDDSLDAEEVALTIKKYLSLCSPADQTTTEYTQPEPSKEFLFRYSSPAPPIPFTH